MKGLFTIFFLFLLFGVRSQDPETVLGMAAYTPAFADPFSQHANPSILAAMKKKAAGIYSEQKFLVSEWKTAVGALVLPTQSGNFGLWIHYTGTENYSGFRSAFSYARSFGNSFDAGLQFRYYHAAVAGYSSLSGLGYTVSALFHLNSKFHTGINFSNEGNEDDPAKANKKLPLKFNAGFGYSLSRLVFLTTTIEKERQSPVNISAGIHYAFHEKIFFRSGFASATKTWLLSGGIKWKQLCIQLVACMHPVLGLTPGLQLMIEEKKTEK
jgi:hypothetical protein